MRNFLKVFLTISVITLLLMVLLDNIYSYAFKNGQPRSKIQNILQLRDKSYDLAFFGSSRTLRHIDCNLITELTGKSCINFGISAGSPGDMLILMKLSKERNVGFEQVFMQVDYNFESIGISDNFKANLVPFINESSIKNQLEIYKKDFSYRRIPFFRFMINDKIVGIREATASFLKLKQNTNIEIGFSPNQGIGRVVAGNFPETTKNKSQELDQMQEIYKDTNTKLIFFTAPYCNQVKNRNYMDKVQLKIELHNYVSLFDEKAEYFYDCGHLNEIGAKIFTKTIVTDLIE